MTPLNLTEILIQITTNQFKASLFWSTNKNCFWSTKKVFGRLN
jgi:hypothetical protein